MEGVCGRHMEKKIDSLKKQLEELRAKNKKLLVKNRRLQETRNLYMNQLLSMGDILFFLDENHKFVDVQSNGETPLLEEPEKFIDKKINDIIPQDTTDKYFNAVTKLKEGGEPQKFEYSLKINDQTHNFLAILNLSNQDNIVLATIRDITNYKKVEKELKKETTLFECLFNNSPESIVITKRDGEIIRINKEFEKMFGYTREEARGKNVDDLVAPEEFHTEANRLTEKVGKSEQIREETIRKRKDGTELFVSILGAPVHIDGEQKIVFGIYRDITKRKKFEQDLKKSEALYRTLIENTGTATVIIEADNLISFANKKFEALSGFPNKEVVNQKKWKEFIPENSRGQSKEYIGKGTNNKQPISYQYETEFINSEEEIKNVLITTALIPGTRRSVVSIIDLTDKKKLEQQLQQAQKLESVGNLAAGVAHDFNNILTVIQVNNEMADMKLKTNSALSKHIKNIDKATKRATKLTEQLLLFSRKHNIQKVPVNLNECIQNLLKMLNRLIGEDIDICTELAEDLWKIEGDINNLEQVIMNLVVNARDAMPKGGEISIVTDNICISESSVKHIPESQAGEYVRLMIEDTGCGIEKDLQDKIFDPFFTTKDSSQGTGMGLSVVYGIIRRHNGWINLYSEPGSGTIFKIYFPRLEASQTETDKEEKKKVGNLQGKGEHILFIEDEPSVIQVGQAMLEHNGYQVSTAETGHEATEIFNQNKDNIDLVLSDVVLPDINGIDLIEKFHKIDKDLPVILCSGYTEKKSHRSVINEKGFAFIQKPFTIKEVLTRIRECLSDN
jgi:PAS domain S-box-containing protein